MHRFVLLSLAVAAGAFMACGPEVQVPDEGDEDIGAVGEISSALRPAGDVNLGRELVLNNGRVLADGTQVYAPYLSCGLPQGVVNLLKAATIDVVGNGPTIAGRTGKNAALPFHMTTHRRPNGVEVVTSNCLLCHAQKLGDSVILGLPNSALDFTQDPTMFGLLPFGLDVISLGLTPEENVELARYRRVSEAGSTAPRPDTKGVNMADVMFGIIAAHRQESTLLWKNDADPRARLDRDIAYTDVPAWWNMKFRSKMFYSGVGGGDHARIMMSAALLCLDDTAEATRIDSYFHHVDAFIKSLKPPVYTAVAKRSIDSVRAARGEKLFKERALPGVSPPPGAPAGTKMTCMGCHGDGKTTGPAFPVDAAYVGTDPVYAKNASLTVDGASNTDGAIAYYFKFFGQTWFSTTPENAAVVAQTAKPVYWPPPLAGVWATAPYFHNASVPTLEGVLNPAKRPNLYRRAFNPEHYDFGGGNTPRPPRHNSGVGEVGWPYEPVWWKYFPDPILGWQNDATVYDVSRAGYGNQGHTFAAGLTDAERKDLIEFLKTL